MENQLPDDVVTEFWNELCNRGGDCPESEVLAQYLDEQLPADRRRAVAAHVARCCYCISEFGRLFRAIEFRDVHRDDAIASILQEVRGEAPEPPSPRLPQNARNLKKWPSMQTVLAILLLVTAGFASGCGVAAIYEHIVNRVVRAFWQSFPSPTQLVIGNAKVFIEGEPHSEYIGVGDTKSVAVLYEYLAEARKSAAEVRLRTSSEFQSIRELPSGSILIGGPSVNNLTLETLGKIKSIDPHDEHALKDAFRFVGAEHVVRNAFVRASTTGKMGIEDVKSGKLFAWDPNAGKTCALLARATIDQEGKPVEVMIVAGFDDVATAIAAQILTKPRYSTLLKQLDEAYRAGGGLLVFVSSTDGEIDDYHCVSADNSRWR